MTKTGNKNGMNWITPRKRLAIYLRDGMTCVYCHAGVESGSQFTLDHLRPRSKGGTNDEANLITACMGCNTARGNRSYVLFLRTLAAQTGESVEASRSQIRRCTRRSLLPFVKEAEELIARRGGFSAAVYGTLHQINRFTFAA